MLDSVKRLFGGSSQAAAALQDAARARAEAAIVGKDWRAAETEYRALTSAAPQVANYWLGLGQALAELSRHPEAMAAFQQVLALEPEQSYAVRALADLRAASAAGAGDPLSGEAAGARQARAFEAALADLEFASREARRLRADWAVRRTDWTSAEFEYGWLLEDFAEDATHWLGWGQALAELGRHADAIVAMREALMREPERLDALLGLSDLEAVRGRPKEAEALDARALPLAKASPAYGAHVLRLLQRAAHRAEEKRDWAEMERLYAELSTLQPSTNGYVDGRLKALARLGRYDEARDLAYRRARQMGDLAAVHALMESYREAGRLRHARALAHLLARRWIHSPYHQRLYARLVAAQFGIGAGDAAFRKGAARSGGSHDMDRCYYEVAIAAHDHQQAYARLRWYLERHGHDLEAQVALGYVMANTLGIDAAERRFERLSLEWMLDAAPLRALAHMAMRRRDRSEALRRWRRFADVYPQDVQAVVESSRALFELGRPAEAVALSRRWILENAPVRDMEQFYARLLATVGDFEAAEQRATVCLEQFGPAWIAQEALIIARGNRGRLVGREAEIVAATPQISTHDDLKRFYQAVRLLEYFGAAGEVLRAVLPTISREHDLAWTWPYLHHGTHALAADPRAAETDAERASEARAERDHARLAALIGTGTLDRWPQVGSSEVDAVLEQGARERPSVHVFNMFEQPNGGSELHALDLGTRLKPYADVQFWAPENPHPAVRAEYGATGIGQDERVHPQGGVLVFVGVYYDLGPWLKLVKPKRVLALYNTFDAVKLAAFARTIFRYTGVKLELLFCSDMMRDEVRLPGLFEPSPTDLDEFSPVGREARADRFVIGRHSRDVVEKHDVDDGRVYQALVRSGAEVRLLGATCMRSIFPADPAIHLLPAQRGGMREYLGGLDCFYYRTGTWIEPWGRVVIEAMAMGIPVVVHERGGYAEAVSNGVDGFVFRTSEEAIEQLQRLQSDLELRTRIGAAGRAKAEALLGPEALKRLLAYYLV